MENNPRIVVLTTAYNCKKYIEKCLNSIKDQKYTNFVCFILDDLSTDGTLDVVKKLIDPKDQRFFICVNMEKMYQCRNYDKIIRNTSLVKDTDIIVEVDGDDYLPDSGVFDRVVAYYSNSNVWMTYGQFKYTSNEVGFAQPVNFKQLRTSRFTATHLRTWRAKLWRRIEKEDLLVNGKYPECAGDVFFMFPMLEMCGPKHALFVHHINYIYNFENPIGDSRGDKLNISMKYAELGRIKRSYNTLESLYE